MTRLYLNKDSQSASCTIKRSDISIQTKHFLSQRQNTFSVWRYLSHTPHFSPRTSTQYLSSVSARVPGFPLRCPVGFENVPCQLRNVISWIVASCLSPLRNLQLRVLFLCLFEAQIWSPNGDGIEFHAESNGCPTEHRWNHFTLLQDDPLCNSRGTKFFSMSSA